MMTRPKREEDEFSIFDKAEQEGGLKVARHVYAQTYGVEITDKKIDLEIQRALLDYFSEPGLIKISAKVLLAIWLRENALRGRGKRKSPQQLLVDERAVRKASRIKATLMADGLKADEAATVAAEKVKHCTTLTVNQIIYRMRKPRPRKSRSISA